MVGALTGSCGCRSEARPPGVAAPGAVSWDAKGFWLPIQHGVALAPASGLHKCDGSHGDGAACPGGSVSHNHVNRSAAFSLPDDLEVSAARLVARLNQVSAVPYPVLDLKSRSPEAYYALGDGWSYPEAIDQGPVRWALYPDSTILFDLQRPANVHVHVAVLRCFDETTDILVNDRFFLRVGRSSMDTSMGCQFVIPQGLVKAGRNRLTLVHNNVPPPGGDDPRYMAVLFQGIVLRPDDGYMPVMPGLAEDRAYLGSGWTDHTWAEGRVIAWACGGRSEVTLSVSDPSARLLRIRAGACLAQELQVRIDGRPAGSMRASDLTSKHGATLEVPGDIPLAGSVLVTLEVDAACRQAGDERFAAIESIGLEPPITPDGGHLAAELLVRDERGPLGRTTLRGTNWQQHTVWFSRPASRHEGSYLRLAVDSGLADVQVRSLALRAVPAECEVRAACAPYPIEYDEQSAHLFLRNRHNAGQDTRRAFPLGPGQTLTYGLTPGMNYQPTVWVAATCLHTPGRLSISSRGAGQKPRLIQTTELRSETRHYGAFHPIALDLEDYAGTTVDLLFTFSVAGDLDPLEPAPVVYVSMADTRSSKVDSTEAPDIILISIDTLRADYLSCYGSAVATSPSLDRLAAEEGVLFENCVAAAPWTLPSHVAILTGRVPAEVGLYHELSGSGGKGHMARKALPFGELVAGLACVAGRLAERGYETAAITDGGFLSARYGLANGFDSFAEMPAQDARGTMQLALSYLHERRRTRPLFLFLHTYEVHTPYTRTEVLRESELVPPQEVDRFEAAVRAQPYVDIGAVAQILRDFDWYRPEITRALYRGGIRYVDRMLGEFFAGLKRMGAWGDTLIVILSDHGEEFADRTADAFYDAHGRHLHRELVHVPLVIKWPQSQWAGQRVSTAVHHLDIAPTILAAGGVENLASYEGVDLATVVSGGPPRDRPLLSDGLIGVLPEVKAIRQGGYMVAAAMLRSPTFYDLQDDPQELDPVPASRIADSRRLLETLRFGTLRSMTGELVFWYRSDRPIQEFVLRVCHERPPAAVFPYDGIALEQIDCRRESTTAFFRRGSGEGPGQVVLALFDSHLPELEVSLAVNGEQVGPSRWRIGTGDEPAHHSFSPQMAVVSGDRLASLKLPSRGELAIFAVGSLKSKEGNTHTPVTDLTHFSALRALGYVGGEP